MATGTKRRGYETLRDMVLSLGVILLGVLVFVALQPKNDDQNPVPAVDYRPQVDLLRNSAPYAVVIPDPVPDGWQVNYARIRSSPAELHMGLVLDRKRFAQLDETSQPTPPFFDEAKVPAQADGSVTVAGATYEVRRTGSGDDERVALVRRLPTGAVLTLSDGDSENGASYDELVALAASLREQPVPPGR